MTFQGNHAWQEGHSHLNMSLLPESLGCSSLLQQQKLCPEREGTVFCTLANSVRSQMGTWAKGMATSHSRMAQSLLTAPALPAGLVLKPTARTNL